MTMTSYLLDVNGLVFVDVKTAPKAPDFLQLAEPDALAWIQMCRKITGGETNMTFEDHENLWKRHAYKYAEFSKIVCIGIGMYVGEEFKIVAIYEGAKFSPNPEDIANDEADIIKWFNEFVEKGGATKRLCAYNGNNFDFPFFIKRSLISGIPLIDRLRIAGKKPWDISLIDPMNIWTFGSYNGINAVPLDILANAFGIQITTVDKGDVWKYYYDEKGKKRIVNDCKKDIQIIHDVVKKMNS